MHQIIINWSSILLWPIWTMRYSRYVEPNVTLSVHKLSWLWTVSIVSHFLHQKSHSAITKLWLGGKPKLAESCIDAAPTLLLSNDSISNPLVSKASTLLSSFMRHFQSSATNVRTFTSFLWSDSLSNNNRHATSSHCWYFLAYRQQVLFGVCVVPKRAKSPCA